MPMTLFSTYSATNSFIERLEPCDSVLDTKPSNQHSSFVQLDGNRYYLDFILRDGPCRSGNTIKLIELRGYPPDLADEARRMAARQLKKG